MAMEITDILSSITFDFAPSAKLTEPDHRVAFELALAFALQEVGRVVPDATAVRVLRKAKKTKGRYSELVAEIEGISGIDDSLSKHIANIIYQSSDQDLLLEISAKARCNVLVCADPIYCRVIFDEDEAERL